MKFAWSARMKNPNTNRTGNSVSTVNIQVKVIRRRAPACTSFPLGSVEIAMFQTSLKSLHIHDGPHLVMVHAAHLQAKHGIASRFIQPDTQPVDVAGHCLGLRDEVVSGGIETE